MVVRIVKRFLFFCYVISKINWFNVFRLLDSKSKKVVMIFPSFPRFFLQYFLQASFENDLALVNAILKQNEKFNLVIGQQSVLNIKCKTVYFNLSNLFYSNNANNYIKNLHEFQRLIVSNGNIIIPSEYDSLFWENKVFMHSKFLELNISHPKTLFFTNGDLLPKSPNINFPALYKPANSSGSLGIIKLSSLDEYRKIILDPPNNDFLVQELVEMRRDLRLIFIGNELVLHYWRINKTENWLPTSKINLYSRAFYF